MNKILLLSAIILLSGSVSLTSCDKAKDLVPGTTVTWDGIDVTITIPPVSDTAMHTSMGTGSFSFDIDSFMKNKTSNAFGANDIDKIEVTSCDLEIQNPDAGNNFQNFRSVYVYINSDTKPTSEMIANIDNNPDIYSDTIKCPIITKPVLKDFFNKSGPTVINYVVGGQLRTPTTNSTTHIARVRFTLTKI